MNDTYLETENAWEERCPPRAERASVSISAWTTDDELAAIAADRVHVYGNEYDLDMRLRLVRSELRAAAMEVAGS